MGKFTRTLAWKKTSITLYEYYEDKFTVVDVMNTEGIRLHRDPTDGLARHVFIVEDLPQGTIHALGEAFGVTP